MPCPPSICQPRHLRFSGPFCSYCCFLLKKLTNIMLPSCSPQRAQVAGTPVHAQRLPTLAFPPHPRWLATWGGSSLGTAFSTYLNVFLTVREISSYLSLKFIPPRKFKHSQNFYVFSSFLLALIENVL